MTVRLHRRSFLQVTAALAAAAALRPGRGWSQDGKVLKIRSNRDIQVLDPGFMIGGTEIDLQEACLGSLVTFKPGNELGWQPSAFVESVTEVDPTHIKFTLKPGIVWTGDNGELTAEDVKFSYERMADPKNEMAWKDKWSSLQEVQVLDK
jgi:peptide/nickel transport system substrate-binding protein